MGIRGVEGGTRSDRGDIKGISIHWWAVNWPLFHSGKLETSEVSLVEGHDPLNIGAVISNS